MNDRKVPVDELYGRHICAERELVLEFLDDFRRAHGTAIQRLVRQAREREKVVDQGAHHLRVLAYKPEIALLRVRE